MPADCPLAHDLVPIKRAERQQVEHELPWWFVRVECWLEDLRAHEADNADIRAAIAKRCEEGRR